MSSNLSKARGLGSAKSGVEHWWLQRITAFLLIPFGIWFIFSFFPVIGADYESIVIWLHSFGNGVLLVFFLSLIYSHAYLGLQVVIEDYISRIGVRLFCILMLKATLLLLWLSSVLAVIRFAL